MHAFILTFFVFGAEYAFMLVALCAFAVLFLSKGMQRERIVVFMLIDLALTYLAGFVAALFYYDPRPFVSDGIVPLVYHAADNGFPSGHTLFCAMLAASCTVFSKRWGAVMWALTLWVGVSRVYVGVHHWIDIAASIIIALLAAYAVAESGLAEKAFIASRRTLDAREAAEARK